MQRAAIPLGYCRTIGRKHASLSFAWPDFEEIDPRSLQPWRHQGDFSSMQYTDGRISAKSGKSFPLNRFRGPRTRMGACFVGCRHRALPSLLPSERERFCWGGRWTRFDGRLLHRMNRQLSPTIKASFCTCPQRTGDDSQFSIALRCIPMQAQPLSDIEFAPALLRKRGDRRLVVLWSTLLAGQLAGLDAMGIARALPAHFGAPYASPVSNSSETSGLDWRRASTDAM